MQLKNSEEEIRAQELTDWKTDCCICRSLCVQTM